MPTVSTLDRRRTASGRRRRGRDAGPGILHLAVCSRAPRIQQGLRVRPAARNSSVARRLSPHSSKAASRWRIATLRLPDTVWDPHGQSSTRASAAIASAPDTSTWAAEAALRLPFRRVQTIWAAFKHFEVGGVPRSLLGRRRRAGRAAAGAVRAGRGVKPFYRRPPRARHSGAAFLLVYNERRRPSGTRRRREPVDRSAHPRVHRLGLVYDPAAASVSPHLAFLEGIPWHTAPCSARVRTDGGERSIRIGAIAGAPAGLRWRNRPSTSHAVIWGRGRPC